jgi:putative spermidine/putrescine transport system ATP-binding protein
VTLEGLEKRYGDVVAVDRLSLFAAEGEFLVLLGPSGCGKTTTLRLIAGFAEADAGRVRIGPREVTREPPYRRNLGIVFQNYALFPHLDVFENVAFGLRRRRVTTPEIARRVERILGLVRLGDHARRLPRQLSGGQQQRVAIARALVIEPDLLLLDEPLSNLDAKLRHDVRQEIRRLQQLLKITTVMVTHDQDEAMAMGDRLAVLNEGRLQQLGTPRELYETPANLFVASFIGQANFLTGRVAEDAGVFRTETGLAIRCRSAAPGVSRGASRLMIRPEAIAVLEPHETTGDDRGATILDGTVEALTYLGGQTELGLRLAGGERLTLKLASRPAAHSWPVGATLRCRIDPDAAVAIADGSANAGANAGANS